MLPVSVTVTAPATVDIFLDLGRNYSHSPWRHVTILMNVDHPIVYIVDQTPHVTMSKEVSTVAVPQDIDSSLGKNDSVIPVRTPVRTRTPQRQPKARKSCKRLWTHLSHFSPIRLYGEQKGGKKSHPQLPLFSRMWNRKF